MLKRLTLAATAAMLTTTGAWACEINQDVSVLGNDFPAIQAITGAAKECGNVNVNLNEDFKDIMIAALTANPSQFSSVVANNGVLVQLMNDGLVRPLDDLVAKHGQGLQKSQLITVDGKVMAIAFMANAQHLFARTDVLKQVGADVPSTYEDVIAAAEKIRAAGIMEHPVALNTEPGWNLGEEFVNMYMSTGAPLFEPGTAKLAISGEAGVKTLNMLKSLVGYSNPDYLTFNSNATQAAWEAGQLALATMWGSRGGAILDDEGASAEIVSNTVLAAAPSFGGTNIPASTLWWDGFTIATNVSDDVAEATFIAMMNGISSDVVKANNDAAVWLSEAYVPSAASAGVAATASGGAKPYPMLPQMSQLHTSAGAEIADFLQGKESAEQALADIEAAYNAAAKEQGFL